MKLIADFSSIQFNIVSSIPNAKEILVNEIKKKTRFLWIIGYAIVLIIAFVVIKSDTSSGFTTSEQYKQEIRNALAEVNVPTSNNQSDISAASQSLSNFMLYRSGVQLSQSNKSLLETAELNFWSDSKRVNSTELAQIITDIANENIPQLSNGQIDTVTESFRGFNSQGVPAGYAQGRNFTKLRASGRGRMSATNFSTELTSLRDGGIESKIAQAMISLAVSGEVDTKVKTIAEAEPNFFGSSNFDMTPIQALLITYSVVTDDQLLHDESTLQQKMQALHQGLEQITSQSFPSPQGHKAYGDNGYMFSSPASVVLSDASITRLINLIQERGN